MRAWSVISFSWLRRREGGRRKTKGGGRQLVCRSPSADHVSLSVPESLSRTVQPLLSYREVHVRCGEPPGNWGLNARSPVSSPDHSLPEMQVTAKRGLGVGSPAGGVSGRALPEAHQPHRGHAKRSGSPEFTMSTGSSGVPRKGILRFLYVKRARSVLREDGQRFKGGALGVGYRRSRYASARSEDTNRGKGLFELPFFERISASRVALDAFSDCGFRCFDFCANLFRVVFLDRVI